jgi:hypothetical protein
VLWEDRPPERLTRFDAADWPTDGNVREAFGLWCAARGLFWAERKSWPTGFLGRFHEEADMHDQLFPGQWSRGSAH